MVSQLRSAVRLYALVALATPIAVAPARGAGLPAPAYPVSVPTLENVVEERMFFYRSMDYQPPVAISPVVRAAAGSDTPEAATVALASAMLAGDLEWFRGQWTDASRQLMAARDRQQGRDDTFWPALWRERLVGKRLFLTHRIESGPYVLIVFRVSPSDDLEAEGSFDLINAFEAVGGAWLATQALAEDPVLHYWDRPGFRVQKMVRNIDSR